ncbi:hypothetical protein ElyMa_001040100 [Elysia marginata]|uniref:Uncharacterized protein n=1 Tax=Elysia marginata TaxID=1093978 RepID=A0AAV4HQ22_9GAST|nr:hypothetical protein ElyMa_001040100 [Elysia marginata]
MGLHTRRHLDQSDGARTAAATPTTPATAAKVNLPTLTTNRSQPQSCVTCVKIKHITRQTAVKFPKQRELRQTTIAHIVIDKSKFTSFHKDFNSAEHVIELADGTRLKRTAEGQGDATVF